MLLTLLWRSFYISFFFFKWALVVSWIALWGMIKVYWPHLTWLMHAKWKTHGGNPSSLQTTLAELVLNPSPQTGVQLPLTLCSSSPSLVLLTLTRRTAPGIVQSGRNCFECELIPTTEGCPEMSTAQPHSKNGPSPLPPNLRFQNHVCTITWALFAGAISRQCFRLRLLAHISDSPSEQRPYIVQELCENRGSRPGLSVLTSLLASVDVKLYWTVLRHWSQLVPNMSADIWGH